MADKAPSSVDSFVVTGGAGYVGGVVCDALLAAFPDRPVVVADDLSRGHVRTVRVLAKRHPEATIRLVVVDIASEFGDRLKNALKEFGAVSPVFFHMAALAEVAESVSDPGAYAMTNCLGSARVASAAAELGAAGFIFSSTAATYGELESDRPFVEEDAQRPINPYGWSKLAAENVVFGSRGAFPRVVFRYFNAGGAVVDCDDQDLWLGEDHDPETHLVPCAVLAALRGEEFRVHGMDYSTPDGSCVRDVVHVSDLARAHVAAVNFLTALRDRESAVFNLGTSSGVSVLEVARLVDEMTREKSGMGLKTVFGPRRSGDPARLIASADTARKRLGWAPSLGINDVIRSAAEWHFARQKNWS